jgi:phosphoribosyl 1,2-cyclic phosphate phosphodiesterase
LVEVSAVTILFDMSPDLREQLIDARVGRIDAVVMTHAHADHLHGIDDILARLDTGRQFRPEPAVIEAFIHMRQDAAARPYALDPAERLAEVAEGRVRRPADAVDDPQFDPGERCECVVVELGHIGRIGHRPDAQTERRAVAMILHEWDQLHAANRERSGNLVGFEGWLGASA